MRPEDRENMLYRSGKRNQINFEENYVFNCISKKSSIGLKILDLGCGSGEIACLYSNNGFQVICVDFSSVAIELCNQKNLKAFKMDIDLGLDFKDNSFDFVIAGDVIEHVFDPIFVFNEIHRVLKPNGELFATLPYDLNLFNRKTIFTGHSYQEFVYKKFGHYKHHTFFSEYLLKFMLNVSGLNINFLHYLYYNRFKSDYAITQNNKFLKLFSKAMIVNCKISHN